MNAARHGRTCRHLARLRERHAIDEADLEALAAAYNAGAPRHDANGEWRNQSYVEKVRAAGGFR